MTAARAVPPAAAPEFRGRIYDSVIDTIGATPLVRFSRLETHLGLEAEIIGKLEFFNPLASVKDRIGLAMIQAAEASGQLKPGGTLVEPTSGNTGIALAFVAAAKGYRLILTMPESMSIERRRMLKLLGAELELTPAAAGMRGAISRAEELLTEIPGSIMPQQFKNAANPAVHRRTTAEEIWKDTDGRLDVFVAGVGEVLKPRLPNLKIVAVEPEDSAVLSGRPPGPHKIQGIGAGFVPDILNKDLIDEILPIANQTAFDTARLVARTEGIPVGISSGAAVAAAIEVAKRPGSKGKRILVIIPSFAERYLSTALFEGL